MAISYLDGQTIAPEYNEMTEYPLAFTPTTPIIEGYNTQPVIQNRPTLQYISRGADTPDIINTDGEFVKGVKSGVDLLQQAGYGAIGMAGNTINAVFRDEDGVAVGNALRDFGYRGIQRQQDDLAWQAAAVNSISDISGVGDFMNWAAWNVGQTAPMMLSTLATGGTAGALSKAATSGSNALVKAGLNNYIKNTIGKEVFEKATDETKKKVVQSFINQQAVKTARNVGALQAMVTESGLNWAEVASQLQDPSQANAATAAFFGTIAGGLEMVGIDSNLFRTILGRPISKAADKELKKGLTGFLQRRLVGGLKGAGSEGTAEALQELTSILNTVTQIHGETFDSEDAIQILNAFAVGGLIGGPIGAVTGPAGNPVPADSPQEVMREKNPEILHSGTERVHSGNVGISGMPERFRMVGPMPQAESPQPNEVNRYTPSYVNTTATGLGAFPERANNNVNRIGGINNLPERHLTNLGNFENTTVPLEQPVSPRVGISGLPERQGAPVFPYEMFERRNNIPQNVQDSLSGTGLLALPSPTQVQSNLTSDGSVIPSGPAGDWNPTTAQFDTQINELNQALTESKQQAAATLLNLKTTRADLLAKQTQARDVDPQAYEEATAQLKQFELAMTNVLAQQAQNQEAAKNQIEKITQAKEKVLAGLTKESTDNALRNARIVQQPRLSSGRVQSALESSKREINNYRERVARDLRDRIKKLEDLAEQTRRISGYDAMVESMLLKAEESRKKLITMYKESDSLIKALSTIDNDNALDPLADSIDNFFDRYKSTREEMQPSAAVTRQQLEQEVSQIEIDKLEEQQKAIREQQKLIDQDPFISDLGKTLSKSRTNRRLQDLENLKGYGFSTNMNRLERTLQQEARTKAEQEVISIERAGVQQNIELMEEAQAVNQDVATAAQNNVNQIIEETSTKVKEVQPLTETHPVVEVMNAETTLDNIEVDEQIEEFILKDKPADYETELAHINMQDVIADAQLSDVTDATGAVSISPAKRQIDEMYAEVNDNGQAALVQYASEVAEATAAERSQRTNASVFKNKNKLLRARMTAVHTALRSIASVNRELTNIVTFVNSATDVNVPVEVQNIVSINPDTLSVYHNGRVYIYLPALDIFAKPTPYSLQNVTANEILSTVSKTLGINYVFNPDALKRIQDKITKDPNNIRQHLMDEFRYSGDVLTPDNVRQIVDNLIAQQKNSTIAQAQSYYSTINNTPVVTNNVPPMWGLLFGTTAQANTYEVNQADMTDSFIESKTPVNKTNTIKFNKPLSNQSDFIKDIFMNKWRPIVSVNGQDNFVTIYSNASDTRGIQVRIDPKTKKAFANNQAALDAVVNDTALLSVPMMDLMKLYLRNFASPKKLSQALRALGVRAAQYDGRVTLFAGDDTNLVPYFPDQPLPSMITKEDMVMEEIISESSILSDNIADITDAETQALEDYFNDSVNKSRAAITESQQAFADGVNDILELYPVLRENTIVVKDMNDARIPADTRQGYADRNENPVGIFVETTGKIFLVLDNVPVSNDLKANRELGAKVMIHEGIVHYGFTQLFNNTQKKDFLRMVNAEINKSKAETKGVTTGLQIEFDRFKKENPAYFSNTQKKKTQTAEDAELVRIEEFIAWVAEQQSAIIDGKSNPNVLTSWLLKILARIKAFLGMKNTTFTIGDLYDSIKASAYKLKQMEPDSLVTAPINTRGLVNIVTAVPVESNYLQGAKFNDFASALAYTLDVANSHRYAFGIPPVDAEYMYNNNQIIDADANIKTYPALAQLAQQANIQQDITVRDFLATMSNAHGADVLRAANIKIVKNGNDFISLFSDNTITYANENGIAAMSTMNTIKEFLQLEDVTVDDANELISRLSSEEAGVLNGQIKANAQRILKALKSGEIDNLTTMDKLITNTVMSKLVTDNDVSMTNPVDEAIIENNSFVQRAIYNAYKGVESAKKGIKDVKKGVFNLDNIVQRGKAQFIDQWNALKEVQDFYAKHYGSVFKESGWKGVYSTYNELSTMSNRVSERRQWYYEKFIKPIEHDLSKVKLPKSTGVFKTSEDYIDKVIETAELLAHAEHAKERNAALRAEQIAAIKKQNKKDAARLIREINESAPSGMSDAVADSIIEDYSGAEWTDLRKAIKRIQAMNRQVLDDYYNAGVIKKADYDAILATYENYVPLIADEVLAAISPDTAFLKSSATVSTNKRRIINRATGLPEDVQISSIIAQSIRKAQDSPLVIARNEVGRKLLDLVTTVNAVEEQLGTKAAISSKETLWEISPTKGIGVGTKFSVSKNGLVYTKKNHKYEGDKNVSLITVIDKQGNEQIIAIKDKELGKALTASNVAIPNTFIRYLSYVTRQMSRLMTSRSPQFIISNPIRDIQQAIINSSSSLRDSEFQDMFGTSLEDKKNVISKIRKKMFSEFKDLKTKKFIFDYYKATNQKLSGLDIDALKKFEKKYANADTLEMFSDFQDFIKHGGKTSITAMLDLEATYKDIRNNVRRAKTAEGKRTVIDSAIGYLDVAADVSETMVRYATYKAFYSNAQSHINSLNISPDAKTALLQDAKKLSARLALDSTVNFSKRGAAAGSMNALYAFSSVALQSAQRSINHLWRKGDTVGANSGRLARYFGGYMLSAALIGELCVQMMGDDEDGIPLYFKIPEYIRNNNIIIPAIFGDGGYIKIPLPFFMNAFWGMGANLHAAGHGYMSVGNAATSSLKQLYSTGLPWNLPEEGFGALVPTFFRPLYQVSANKTFAGTPIFPESTFMETPDHLKYWSSTKGLWIKMAEFANTATFGDKYNSGLIDISPETIEHIALSYTGGLGRMLSDTINLSSAVMNGSATVPNPRIPVVSGVTGVIGTSGTASLYYTLAEKINTADKAIKDVMENPEATVSDRAAVRRNNLTYSSMKSQYNSIDGKIKKLRDSREATTDMKQINKYNEQINFLQKQLLKLANKKGLVTSPD